MTAIKEAIQRLTSTNNSYSIVNAEVISVDKVNDTCEVRVLETDEELSQVRLRASIDDSINKVVIYPSVGSEVSIGFLFGSDVMAIVINVTEVDEIVINGDQFGGLGKTQVIAQRIKRLEDSLKALETKYNLHTHAGSGVPTVAPFLSNENLTPATDQESISNLKVKHG